VLVQNLLVSREPLYGVGQWAARHVPGLLGLTPEQLPALNDDRVGRCLDRLFDADIPSLTLAVVTHAVREFGVALDELHNDSTTITFHGDYEAADRDRREMSGKSARSLPEKRDKQGIIPELSCIASSAGLDWVFGSTR
jgi:hypothetical protein